MRGVTSSRLLQWTTFLLIVTLFVSLMDSPAEAAKRRRRLRGARRPAVVRIRRGVPRQQFRRQGRVVRRIGNQGNIVGANRFGFNGGLASNFNFDPQGLSALPAADANEGGRRGRGGPVPQFTDGKDKPVGDLRPVVVENRTLAGLMEDRQGNKFALETAASSNDAPALKALNIDQNTGKIELASRAEVKDPTVRDSIDLFNNRERLRN